MRVLAWLTGAKTYLTWGALGALAAVAGVQTMRLANAHTAAAKVQVEWSAERVAASRRALRESERVADAQFRHAAAQQEKVDAFTTKIASLEDRARRDGAESGRLRSQLAAFAALDREAARTDPNACQRVADRSEVLAGVADRAAELLRRGRRIVEQRDAEVELLLGLQLNDRALLAPTD